MWPHSVSDHEIETVKMRQKTAPWANICQTRTGPIGAVLTLELGAPQQRQQQQRMTRAVQPPAAKKNGHSQSGWLCAMNKYHVRYHGSVSKSHSHGATLRGEASGGGGGGGGGYGTGDCRRVV